MSNSLRFAERYVTRGWRVFPVYGKRPIGVCAPNGCHSATTDINKIREWYGRFPKADLALGTGAGSDLVVVDFDPKYGADARAFHAKHAASLGDFAIVRTGGGGEHWYYRYPDQKVGNSCGKIGPGIDIRGDGGYVVAAPSLHASGRRYRWEHWEEPSPLPNLFFEMLKPKTLPPVARSSPPANMGNTLARARAYLTHMPPSISGQGGHDRLFKAAVMLVRGFDMSPESAFEVLAEYNTRSQPAWSDRDLERKLNEATKSPLPRGFLL